MRPLDRFTSLKMKLGVVIVAATATTVAVVAIGVGAGIPLWVCAVAAGLLSLAMIQVLARGMTSPLREMAAAARAMAAGDYGRRVTDTSRDEVGELARTFNRMAAQLAEVDGMRRDLIATVSHELRTPMSALQAMLENLVDGVERPDPEVLQTMLGQAQRLGRLVDQLLDLSRLESGAIPLQRREFALQPLLDEAVAEARVGWDRAGAARKVELSVSSTPAGLTVEGDPERIHQVLANVLQNALRHSPDGGRVEIAARGTKEKTVIEVADSGPGIPPADAARVFERFYRADSARRSGGGTGLGLAISKWIVDLHGGDIRAEPNSPQGCRMVVTLPRGAAEPGGE